MSFTILLWLIIAMTCVSIGWAMFARWAQRSDARASSNQVNITIYTEQLKSVRRDREKGLITPEEAKALEADISRRLLRAAESAKAAGEAMPGDVIDDTRADVKILSGPEKWGFCIIICTMLVSAILLYALVGRPDLPGKPYAAREESRMTEAQLVMRQLDNIAENLESRDATSDTWQTLGSRYLGLQAFDKAEKSYRKAIEIGPPTADLWNSVGTSLVFQSQGPIPDEAVNAFEEALKLEETNGLALYFLALAALDRGDKERAVDLIKRSIEHSADSAPWTADAKNILDQLTRAQEN